eukprot:3774321-Rhodomonas_salina.3
MEKISRRERSSERGEICGGFAWYKNSFHPTFSLTLTPKKENGGSEQGSGQGLPGEEEHFLDSAQVGRAMPQPGTLASLPGYPGYPGTDTNSVFIVYHSFEWQTFCLAGPARA